MSDNSVVAECPQERAENVGILGIDIYFPNAYVDQTDLEKFNGVPEGKYTIGLGQLQMAFCSDREDIHSICLSVTKSLMDKYSISPKEVGFLAVGTETSIDKSKSVKTVLMDLFFESGNTDIEGIQSTNACYGGTDCLYAIVVAADIAIYASGPARPTGCCGAVAMLLGPNGAVMFEPRLRATHMAHVYDFYKPNLSSEYPIVDGQVSIMCYLRALDRCFQLYTEKASKQSVSAGIDTFDGILFHSPYSKLDTYNDRDLKELLTTISKPMFDQKTNPSLMLTRVVGNMYTASLYASLISYLISELVDSLTNRRLLLFSYGSGMASSMFSARLSQDLKVVSKLVAGIVDIPDRLRARHRVSPQVFEGILNGRESAYNMDRYVPTGPIHQLMKGTFYLKSIVGKYQRFYETV
ncbi:unnamed protein product [Oppiella nova]|uniref:Hydroxymethylglutaryl-CoA synthase n=1 Tax=Oppiella nova TaxID=334625 RepID=A0A7R9M6N3_9ACAR|nr:unnamed protein product [Oppiella nova]CAG2171232.1 unnamed protein product [Oppiella nova]